MLFNSYLRKLQGVLLFTIITSLGFSSLYAQVQPATTTTVSAKTGTVTVNTPSAYPTSPAPPLNYIRTWEPQQPYTSDIEVGKTTHTPDEVNHATQYVDGLGRPLQTVNWQASPAKNDIVAPVYYDEFGREAYKYLPYTATTSDGLLKTNPFVDQNTFYSSTYLTDQGALKNEQFYYSHTVFEPSPLNRTAKTFAPGNSWEGSEITANGTARTLAEKAVSVQYLINSGNDASGTTAVRIWDMPFDAFGDANNIPTSATTPTNRIYAAGQLFKTVTLDEHSNAVVEYKDNEGHVVLKKVQIGAIAADYSGYGGFLSTFYVYDDMGQLRFVIPPRAVNLMTAANNWTLTTDIIKELCFRYEYDEQGRIKAKKVPGADWVYMVYDSRDRLVYTQDGNMRSKSPQQWAYTFYDDMNRPVETGIMTYTGAWSDLVSAAAVASNSTITNGAESGNLTNGTPSDLVVSNRDYTVGQYYNATNSVTWQDGFMTEDGATIWAQILPSTAPSYSLTNETVNMKPLPNTGTYNYYALTYSYYDAYGFGSSKNYSTTNNSSLGDGGNPTATLETVPTTASTMTRALATGARVRVIEDPADLTKGAWLETVTYYDDKGRAVQVQSDNYKGGADVVTTRYNFTNKPVSNYLAHTNPAAGKSSTNAIGVYTSMLYDHEGRVKNVKKQVIYQSNTYSRTVTQNTYDALGQLKTKGIGQKDPNDASTNPTPIESDDYTYNIRGWLKGVNWYSGQTYASQVNVASATTPKWFAFDLSYDWGMSTNQQNGNIAGQRWKSGGDNKERAFGYSYDQANRLMEGDFSQNNGTWGTDPVLNFSMKMGDGSTPSYAYDENGNIRQMQQWGLKGVSSTQIDNLTYKYIGDNSNRLQNVADGNNDVTSQLGDFKYSASYNTQLGGTKTNSTVDYSYDVNGNLTADKNKNIIGIVYNHLNLPWQITMNNDAGTLKGTITYIYDAVGNKLEKRVSEAASSLNGNQSKQTQTTYIGGFVYQNNALQFLGQEEGRIRMVQSVVSGTPNTNFVYDYFLKDHLGNVRMVLTDEVKQDVYPAATLEASGLATEKAYYDIQDGNVVANPVTLSSATGGTGTYYNNNGNPPYNTNPNVNTSAQSAQMYKLNGAGGVKTGLGITLKVMAGDNVVIYGKSYYHLNTNPTVTNSYTLSSALLSLLNSFTGSSVVSGKGITGATLNTNTPTTTPLTTIYNDPNRNPLTGIPKAGINWILFDEQFRPVQTGTNTYASGYDAATTAEKVESHNLTASVVQNGYLYVYCSDESNIDVYFDNLQLIHNHGPLTEETHYYPFGLTMAGISSNAAGSLNNKFEYNGKEKQEKEWSDGTGLETYDFDARMYDEQIGRWDKTDGKAELYFATSPYVYALNQPSNAIDPDGNVVIFINGMASQDVAGTKDYWRGSVSTTSWHNLGNPDDGNHPGYYKTTTTYVSFDLDVMAHLNDDKPMYIDGSFGGPSGAPVNGTANYREQVGEYQGKKAASTIIKNLARDVNNNIVETIKIITHSMGGAYGKGFVKAIKDYIKTLPLKMQKQIQITLVADFDPFQAGDITADPDIKTMQFKHVNFLNIFGLGWLANQDEKGVSSKDIRTNTGTSTDHSIITFDNDVSSLSQGTYKWNGTNWVKQ